MEKRPLTTAEQACFHIVRRVQESSDFAWLMIGTQSLALCMAAVAERQEQPEEQIRQHVEANAASRKETPEIVVLRKRVEAMEGRIENHPDLRVPYKNLSRVEDLLRLAELGVEDLTVDALREALSASVYSSV